MVVGVSDWNPNYYIDELVKWQCLECDKEFILSEYQVAHSRGHIRCPYCISDAVEAYVALINQDTLEELGCMAISHRVEDNPNWVSRFADMEHD